MDSLDLLAREDEFKKLNKQLEKKTESLMKEIEHVMQKQDFFSEFSHNLSTPTHSAKKHFCKPPIQETMITTAKCNERVRRKVVTPPKSIDANTSSDIMENIKEIVAIDNSCGVRVICDCCVATNNVKRSDDVEFLHAFVSVSVQDKVLPASFLKEKISIESICKFLSSKVKLLQEQIDILQATIDKKAAQCKAHLTQQAGLEGERMSLLSKSNSLHAAAADAKAKAKALELRLNEKERLYKEQRSECDRLTCDVKQLRAELAAAAARAAAGAEQVATLTQRVKAAAAEHAEFRDSTRALAASNQSTIAALETRIKALNATIDKQFSLIENLRKQNAILATEGALKALEKDYSNFLNQDL